MGAQRSLRDCVREREGGECTCVSAHTTTRDIPSLSGSRDCLSRERRYTRSYTCRAVGMLDIRGGPLAYIFTIGFIERAFVNGRVVYSHLLRGDIEFSLQTGRPAFNIEASRKKQVQFSSRRFSSSRRLMRAVTQEEGGDIIYKGVKGSRKLCIFRKKKDFGRIMNNG